MKTGRLTWGIRGGLETEQDLLSAQTASAQSRFIQTDKAKLGDLERDRTRDLLENLNQLVAALESEF